MEDAVRRHQAGDLQGAEAGYRRALAIKPDFADALDLLGLVALQSGHPEPALGLIGRALAVNPRHPAYRTHEGMTLAALGRQADAVASFERALKADGKFLDALVNLGHCLLALGRPADALKRFTRAAALAPAAPAIRNAVGVAEMQLGHAAQAEAAFRKALSLAPDFIEARHNLANFLLESGRAADAETEGRALLAATAAHALGHADALMLLAKALTAQDRAGEAVALLTPHREAARSLALDMALGEALVDAERLDEAVALYRDVRTKAPGTAGVAYNLGIALKALGDFEAALAAYDDALRLDPALPDLAYNRALLAMTLGRFADGLAGYELRWTKTEIDTPPRTFPVPRWDGGPVADGKSLLVWAEQGVGDHIVYGSLLDRTLARAGRVVFECDRRLTGLFSRAFPSVTVIAEGDNPSVAIGAEVPMGGLMAAMAPWPEGPPPPARFLEPDPARTAASATALAGLGEGRRIGISWRSARKKAGPKKSVPLDGWGPILGGRDARFVNLQYGETDDEIAAAESAFGCAVFTAPGVDRFADLDGLAALIDGLDLVITASNVTAHIAAALGKPCWLMLQRTPIWYWGHAGSEVLFYPTVRAYRQTRAAEWDDVIAAVAADLDDFLA